ncbi:uncharacterized protein LOC130728465 [Lotus japonicus]|uniref:uncharacterized protein LOC130728465 n=1 Tax=Lotus japonicus TaxID=34305 RepID=UPI0025875024|nr:uncharacterized protein LOC130728465 [Lotus japonicus]
MADSTTLHPKSTSRIQPKPINQGKSCSGFLFKVLFLALLVLVLPLFPSQAPEFVSQTALTKFWELLHLLFIGIAVTYGLFSRRNAELDSHVETHSSDGSSPSYVSKMFPGSALFGDGGENSSGFDEKRVMHCWDPPQNYDGEQPGGVCSNVGGTVGVFDEQYKPQLPIPEDNFGFPFRYDGNGTNVVQAWNSEYYHSEPVVVVAQPYVSAGESGEVVGHKPLGLPVRSLRSVAREGDGPNFINESDSSSGSRASSKSSDKSRGNREFGDLGPSNLEKQFNDAAAVGGSASPIPWRSRGGKMEREKSYGNVTHPSHFRPLSFDEAVGSLQSTTSFSPHSSMYSSLDSISSDKMNVQGEEMRQMEGYYVPASENMNFQEKDVGRKKTSYVPPPESINFQDEDMERWKASYLHASEKMNFLEKDMGRKKASYVPPPEIINCQEEDMERMKTSYVPTFEKMNFLEKDKGRKKASYVPRPENINFREEDMEHRETSFVPASENTNFQKIDMGRKISRGRNRRISAKGKYADVSNPSHFRPISVDETQLEALSSQCFQSMGSFSSQMRMNSSLDSISPDNMDFREEDMRQKKTSPMHASEDMSFQAEEVGDNNTSYVHASENVNFQEEDMGHKKSSYAHSSENVNFQEEDMGYKKSSYVHSSENMNFQGEDMGQKKSSFVHSSENGNFQEEDMGHKKTSYVAASENVNFREVDLGKKISQVSSMNLMMETKGKYAAVSHPSHFRPISGDEAQFESLGSRSFQSVGSFSSQTSSRSSLDSVSSENMNSPNEDLGEKKSLHGSSSSSSSSPSLLARRNGEASLQSLQDGTYKISSMLHDDLNCGLNDELSGSSGTGGEDRPAHKKESGKHAFQSDPEKPARLPKTPSRGKSVRTRRESGSTSGTMRIGEVSTKQTDEKVEKKPYNVDTVLKKDRMKSEEPELLSKGVSKNSLDSYSSKPEVTLSKHMKRDKLEPFKNVPKEDSDEDDGEVSEYVNDSGLDSEVDRKASEFIAKFKAQIRFQKVGSIESSKDQKTIGNNVR